MGEGTDGEHALTLPSMVLGGLYTLFCLTQRTSDRYCQSMLQWSLETSRSHDWSAQGRDSRGPTMRIHMLSSPKLLSNESSSQKDDILISVMGNYLRVSKGGY